MGLIITLIVGALVGWLASMIMGTNAQQGLILNIVVGIVGAFLGGWIFGDLLGFESAGSSGSFSILGILWALLGAIILLAILKAVNVLK